MKRIIAAALLAALASPAALAEDDKELNDTLYVLGYAISQNLERFRLTEDELKEVVEGIEDGVLGRDARIDPESHRTQVQQLVAARIKAGTDEEKRASMEFVAEQAKAKNAESTVSGLVYIPIEEGDGKHPAATDKVTVHYHGTLRDGSVFDSSRERGEPFETALNQVIPCWTEGVQKMKVGGKARLVCPSDIAYGDRGAGSIKPGAALVFEVELLGIENMPAQ